MAMKKLNKLLLICAAFIFCVQCNSPHFYQDQKSIGESWNKDQALKFEFEIKDTVGKYNISLLSRNTNDYPYSNLYIFTKLVDPKGQEYTDTLQYYLAFQDGEWIGKGNNLKEIYLVYRENLAIKDTGKYQLSIWHGMREENLKGIEDISLIVDKTNAQ